MLFNKSKHTKFSFDFAVIGGLIFGFILLGAAIFISGSFINFLNIPSFLIVIGGSFAATMICFSFSDIHQAQKDIFDMIRHKPQDPGYSAYIIIELSKIAREKGVLALEKQLQDLKENTFLKQGLQLVVDNEKPKKISELLEQKAASLQRRVEKTIQVLQKLSEFAPAFGLIGTLVGLVQMLVNLNTPDSIGPSMAVAILTTFYGAVLSNMIFLPLAAKLERNNQEDMLTHKIYIVGMISIIQQENPRQLELQINNILPPEKRLYLS